MNFAENGQMLAFSRDSAQIQFTDADNITLPFVLVRQIVPAVHVVKFRGQRLAAALPESSPAAAATSRLPLVAGTPVGTASCPGEGSLIAPERRVGLVVHGSPSVVSRPLCDVQYIVDKLNKMLRCRF